MKVTFTLNVLRDLESDNMVWLDNENKLHEECIDCGNKAVEGNRCYDCWLEAGRPMHWSNKDRGKLK